MSTKITALNIVLTLAVLAASYYAFGWNFPV